MSGTEDPWANEHHIQRVQSTLDFNIGPLSGPVNTRRMAEEAVKAGITEGTDITPAQFQALMFLVWRESEAPDAR